MIAQPIDTTQSTQNVLTALSTVERKALIVQNDYNTDNQYSDTAPSAQGGTATGKGTGVFLDIYNVGAGDISDIAERKNEIKTNEYNSSNGYPNFAL